MQTIQEFSVENHIRMLCKGIDSRPDKLMQDMPSGSTHWKCTLIRGKSRFTVYFSQGPAIAGEPKIEEVLSCLADDSSGSDDTFESWAADLGYDVDSRKAEKIYQACQKTSEKLFGLLGPELYAELLYETERL